MAESIAVSSPASVPSLAAVSTDGDDSLLQMGEIPANASSQSFSVAVEDQYLVDSWHAIVDDDEDGIEMASGCSSGILSQETLDMDFEVNSQHSLSSAKTLKSPSGIRTNDEDGIDSTMHNKMEFEHVSPDDGPVRRACHGALNISPKQLAEVFAMFAADRKKSTEDKPTTGAEGQPPQAEEPATPAPLEHSVVAATCPPRDNPFTLEERFKSQSRTAHPKLTSEMYWKPRTKTLEKECETLKEILADDSSKILQLKSALETLRGDRLRSLVDIKSCQEKLEATQRELDTLTKEREVWLEDETEYRETIRILKNEVDVMTRDDKRKKSPTKEMSTQKNFDELQQLRLENQLFASQIVDYEAELDRLVQQQVESPCLEMEAEDESKARVPPSSNIQADEKKLSHQSGQSNRSLREIFEQGAADLVANIPFVENVTPSMEEEGIESVGDSSSAPKEGSSSNAAADGKNDGAPQDEKVEGEANKRDCMENIATEFPHHILGNVLGMFTVGGTDESQESDKDEVYVIHEAARPPPTEGDTVHCLQWRSPDELPTVVKLDNVVPPKNAEHQNPPSASSGRPLGDKTNVPTPSMRSLKQSQDKENTAIEVLQDGASQSIEVQLSPSDLGKKSGSSRKDKCDVWNALHCPFSSDSH